MMGDITNLGQTASAVPNVPRAYVNEVASVDLFARQGTDTTFVAWALNLQIVPFISKGSNFCKKELGNLLCFPFTLQAPV